MKIYLLMCQDADVMEDYPEKFFTEKSIADAWCENYNKQCEEYFSDEIEEGDEMPIFYYVEESEIEQGLDFDVLFGKYDSEPEEIECTSLDSLAEQYLDRIFGRS